MWLRPVLALRHRHDGPFIATKYQAGVNRWENNHSRRHENALRVSVVYSNKIGGKAISFFESIVVLGQRWK